MNDKLFKVGEDELTYDELMAKVGAGWISIDAYKEIMAQYNAENLPVEVAAKKGKKKAEVEAPVETPVEAVDADTAQS